MIKRAFTLILVTLILVFPFSSFAHPGRTDSKGGHTNHSTGEYHYHHGYPAHQHENGECPYDFDDETGAHSGTSGGTTKKTKATSTPKPKNVSLSKTNKSSFPILPLLGVAGIGSGGLLFYWNQKEKKKRLLLDQQRLREREAKHNQLVAFYQSHTLRELCGMPDDTTIGADGMPEIIGSLDWGAYYTRYIASYSGTVFHKPTCSSAKYGYRIHVFDKRIPMAPCSRCKPDPLPERSWYDDYLNHLAVCESENITPVLGDVPQHPCIPSLENKQTVENRIAN